MSKTFNVAISFRLFILFHSPNFAGNFTELYLSICWVFCRAVCTDSFVMSDNVSSLQEDNKKLLKRKKAGNCLEENKKLFGDGRDGNFILGICDFLTYKLVSCQKINLFFVLAKRRTKMRPGIAITKGLCAFHLKKKGWLRMERIDVDYKRRT